MPRARPRAVRKYSDEFKLTAVHLSNQPGLQVKTVAAALEIHPFMLSKWRKDVRDGLIRGRSGSKRPCAHAFHVKLIWQARAKTDLLDARKLAELLRVNLFPAR